MPAILQALQIVAVAILVVLAIVLAASSLGVLLRKRRSDREWEAWERSTRERVLKEAEERRRSQASGASRVLSPSSGIVEAGGEVLIFPGSTPIGVPRPEDDGDD